MDKSAFIIANGPLPKRIYYKEFLNQADLILCADGGADHALQAHIRPHFVIGDLDSISHSTRAQMQGGQLILRPSQYATDLEKTLQFAVEQGVRRISVVGISGGRLDHQVVNLNIVEKFCDRLSIEIIDNSGTGRFIRGFYSFQGTLGERVSLIAFRRARGITTQGLKYPLENTDLEWAVNDGLSNEIITNPVSIQVREGTLFLFRARS